MNSASPPMSATRYGWCFEGVAGHLRCSSVVLIGKMNLKQRSRPSQDSSTMRTAPIGNSNGVTAMIVGILTKTEKEHDLSFARRFDVATVDVHLKLAVSGVLVGADEVLYS